MEDKKSPATDLAALFADPQWAARFPPVLTVKQVAELLGVLVPTVYSWSSRGVLNGCKARVGKYVRFLREPLIRTFWRETR
jgi:excisionase family DNA binding protein